MWKHHLAKRSRILALLSALLMAGSFFVPIWRISLDAPQYPEGLGMVIWIHRMTGEGPNDIQNVNLLNHYIGMRPIAPNEIPELRYMPWILGGIVVLTAAIYWIPRVYMALLSVVAIAISALAGLGDFWKWEYDYGHYLNPDAPIRIEGMTYQPPLLACKQLMNITACSYPHVGSILIFAALGILIYILVQERSKAKRTSSVEEKGGGAL